MNSEALTNAATTVSIRTAQAHSVQSPNISNLLGH